MARTKYTKQQIEKVLESLPEELYSAVFSMETAENLWNIYERYDIMDKRAHKISEYAGYVLMGLLLPSEFPRILKQEIKLSESLVKKVAHDINRFVFYPVRPLLEQLYKIEIAPSEKPTKGTQPTKGIEEGPSGEEEPKETPEQDVYREPIE